VPSEPAALACPGSGLAPASVVALLAGEGGGALTADAADGTAAGFGSSRFGRGFAGVVCGRVLALASCVGSGSTVGSGGGGESSAARGADSRGELAALAARVSLATVPTSTLLAAQESASGVAARSSGLAFERADQAATSKAWVASDASSAQGRGRSRVAPLTCPVSSDTLAATGVPDWATVLWSKRYFR
jgi:hypothetical protein